MLTAGPLTDTAIRQTVDQVFRAPEYNRTSALARFFGWLGEQYGRFIDWISPAFGALHRSPPLYWLVVTALIVVLAAIIGRAAYLWYMRSTAAAHAPAWAVAARRRGGRDPWLAAQELAAGGNYTDAAHALYAALLEAAARQQQLRLHPSKTVGDYVRELRARSSALFSRFRDFARSYEVVIYGIGSCDQERYERLRSLALPIIQPAANA